jgi:hypothetical protein
MNEDFQEVFSATDNVSWGKIHDAYGPATDVPDLIRALTSRDAKIRNDAWYQLHGNLWHQGTIYEATAHAVPIFLLLLEHPLTIGKPEILVYLALLFAGRSYWDVHKHLKVSGQMVNQPDFKQQLQRELHWVEATKEAISRGKEQYVRLLTEADPGTRIAAAYLLGVIGAIDVDTLEEITRAAESS